MSLVFLVNSALAIAFYDQMLINQRAPPSTDLDALHPDPRYQAMVKSL